MINIDSTVNKLGFQLVDEISEIKDKNLKKKLKNNIEKSLGVLVSDGVYAYYVFCKAQDGKDQNGNFQKIFIKLPIAKLKGFIISSGSSSIITSLAITTVSCSGST